MPNTESQTKGPRYSGPFRPLSNKNMPELSILHEDSNDEEVTETLLPSASDVTSNAGCKDNYSHDINVLPTSPIHGEIKKENKETEEDIKSYASSKSEIFFDAQEELSSIETLTNEITNSHLPLQRRRGRDESNFDESFYNKVLQTKNEMPTTDERDVTSKKINTRRTVSFSNASRRWSQLRSANKISSNFSKRSKRQSSTSNSIDEVEMEGVQLRKKR